MLKTMLATLACCSLFALPALADEATAPSPDAAAPAAGVSANGKINWKTKRQWQLPAKPLDFAQTLDNKQVFFLTEDHQVHVYTAEGKALGAFPVPEGVSDIEIAPRGEMLYLLDRDGGYTALDVSVNQKIDVTGAPVRGRQDAPVTIVEFSDFQCPFCHQVIPVLERVLARHPNDVRLIFKHMPLSRIHPQAEHAARAAIAAQKQGKFWAMYDALFALPEEAWESDKIIEDTAKRVGLDMARFAADLNSEETRMALAKDMMDAQNADVTGTPTLFINGKPMQERSEDAFEAMIAEALAEAK